MPIQWVTAWFPSPTLAKSQLSLTISVDEEPVPQSLGKHRGKKGNSEGPWAAPPPLRPPSIVEVQLNMSKGRKQLGSARSRWMEDSDSLLHFPKALEPWSPGTETQAWTGDRKPELPKICMLPPPGMRAWNGCETQRGPGRLRKATFLTSLRFYYTVTSFRVFLVSYSSCEMKLLHCPRTWTWV